MEPVRGPIKVLIVEDDLEMAMTIEEAAMAGGYEVCGHARNAIEAARLAEHVDVAIVDIHLDDEDGTAIGKMLSERWNVTVLFATASPEIVSKGFPGAVGVVAKPLSGAEVVAALDYAAARRSGESLVPPPSLVGFA